MYRYVPFRLLAVLAVSTLGLSTAPFALAQKLDPAIELIRVPSAAPRTFGTMTETLYQVPAAGCSPIASTTVDAHPNGYFHSTSGPGAVDCPLNLPAGALIDKFEVVVYDANDTKDVGSVLVVCTGVDVLSGCSAYGTIMSSGTSGAPFNGYLTSDISGSGLVVDKVASVYFVRVVLQQPDDSLQFRQVNAFYRLQVSPAPATATFADVPTSHTYFRAVEALAAAGITSGCGGGNYCVNGAVTRGEMAVFLARALGLHFPD
jgi:hypothetical protein